MLQLNQQGFVLSSKAKIAQRPLIERATLKRVSGIIVHQTGGANAASSLSSYAKADATGAHFLIDRDGTVVRPPNGKPAEVGVYEVVSPQQNQSLKWLVTELSSTFSIPMTEVFRHPIVSRKNPTEAASALW